VTQKGKKPVKTKAEKGQRAEGSSAGAMETYCTLHDASMVLNDSFGETRVVAVAVDPYLIHVYWEVTPEELKKAKDNLSDDYERSRPILRCYGVASSAFVRRYAHHALDVDIDLQARSRYIRLWNPWKAYLIELGLETQDGSFYPIAQSNIAETPRAAPVPQQQQDGVSIQGDSDQAVSKIRARGGRHSFRSSHGTDLARSLLSFGQGGQALYEQGPGIDLADMSEKGFTLGVSSIGGASPRKEKVPADR
jgi:hypothetical protein